MKHLVVLSGAGISVESGLPTFRGAEGLWNGYRLDQVATPQAWENNRQLVLDFYNQRRKQLLEVDPNLAHKILVDLEENFQVSIITQNVDDLHERAGSRNVLHLHGELLKIRSSLDPALVYPCESDIAIGDLCDKGSQLRPHVVWFGEGVPNLEQAIDTTRQADFLLVIGTSLLVYPAAGLVDYVSAHVPIFYIDPNPSSSINILKNERLHLIRKTAQEGMVELAKTLREVAN